jgi:hypothetical protein
VASQRTRREPGFMPSPPRTLAMVYHASIIDGYWYLSCLQHTPTRIPVLLEFALWCKMRA